MSSVTCPSCRGPHEFTDDPEADGQVVGCDLCGATYELRHGSGNWLALAISLPTGDGSGAGVVGVARPAAELPPPLLNEADVLESDPDVELIDADGLTARDLGRPVGPEALASNPEAASSAVFSPGGLRPSAETQDADVAAAATDASSGWDSEQEDFGDLDLPSPRRRGSVPNEGENLDFVVEPTRNSDDVLRDALTSDDLPALKIDMLPAGADGSGDGGMGFGDLNLEMEPMEASSETPEKNSGEGVGFGEIDLGQEVGEEVDFEDLADESSSRLAPPERIRDAPVVGPRPQRTAPVRESTQKSGGSRVLLIGMSLVGLGVVGGLALGLTHYGVFGVYHFEQYLEAAGDPQTIQEIIDRAETQLAMDDYQTTRAAVYGLGDARREYSLARELLTRSILHESLFAARFGGDSGLESRIDSMIRRLDERGGNAAGVTMARGANALRQGRLDAADGYVREAMDEGADDSWFQLLRGELALEQGETEAALELFRSSATQGIGARALWGVARCLARSGAPSTEVQAAVDAVLEANPCHGDARVMAARLAFTAGDLESATRGAEIAAGRTEVDGERLRASAAVRSAAFTVLADVVARGGDWRDASDLYERALEVQGLNANALLGAGRVFIEQRRWHDALVRFNTVVENPEHLEGMDYRGGEPVEVRAKIGAAEAMIQLDRKRDALAMMEGLRQERPDDRHVQLWLAYAQQSIGETQSAEAAFRVTLRANPDWLDAYLGLSQVLFVTRHPVEALAQLSEAKRRVPQNADTARRVAAAELEQGHQALAIVDFRSSLTVEPNYGPAIFGLAVALRRTGELEEAGRQLDALAEQSPSYPGLAVERGRLFEEQGHSQRAVQSYRVALEAAPEDVDLRLRLGVAQALAGELDEAEENLSAVISERANLAEAEYFLGRVNFERGNAEVALRHFERAAGLDPSQAEYHLYIARASLARTGQIDLGRVVRAAEAAAERDPMLADVFWVRAEVALRLGSVRDALSDAEHAIELDAENAFGYAVLGEVRDQLGNWQEAMAAFERAVVIDPGHAAWWYRLGKLRFDNRRRVDSVPALVQAIELAGEDTDRAPWLAEAYRMMGEVAASARRRDEAIGHFRRYLDLSTSAAIDRQEVIRRMERMGVDPETLPVL